MAPIELVDSLIEEDGWEGLLRILIRIAERDEFEIMGDSLRPILQLIEGSSCVNAAREEASTVISPL